MLNITQKKRIEFARKLHSKVTKDWYARSIKINIFQRFWHNRRFNEVIKEIKNLSGTFLDIGCCDGTFTEIILKNSKADKVYAIDVLEKSIKYAKKKYSKNNKLIFSIGEAHSLPFKNKSFNAVFCLEVIEHVESPDIVFKEMKRVLKPNGRIIMLVPSETILFNTIWFFWKKWRGKIWEGTHIQEFSDEKLKRLLKDNGYIIEMSRKFLFGMLYLFKARAI